MENWNYYRIQLQHNLIIIIIIIKEEVLVDGGDGSEGYILDKCSRLRLHYYFTDERCLAEELIRSILYTPPH